ncbi:hypothetical protein P4283_22875 [Bacillus thuringiensis]|nr:hypothetical protein [Bacillus thuringiensis]
MLLQTGLNIKQRFIDRYRKGGWSKEDAITKPSLSLEECMRRVKEKSDWQRIHFGRGGETVSRI